MIIWVHSQNSICANDCGLSQTQCFDFFFVFSSRKWQRACLRFQSFNLLQTFAAEGAAHKPVSHLGRIKKSTVIIVPDYYRIEGVSARVSANDKLLAPI
jgi:hypothetical protein